MRRWRILGVLAAVTALVGALAALAAAPPATALPVGYNFFSGIPAELAHPGGSLPGSNDWTCKPTAAHPYPVVLVHGTGGGAQTNWGVYAPLLANEHYCVFALTYGAYTALPWPTSAIGGMGPIPDSAAQLGRFVDRVLAATGAAKVDIVGHSQGTLVPNYWAKRLGGAAKIDKYISLAPLWLGTDTAGGAELTAFADRLGAGSLLHGSVGAACPACLQMLAGSPFMTSLDADGVYALGIDYTNIVTRHDELVVPYTSGAVPGPHATTVVVQDGCPIDYSDHLAIAGSPRAAAYVLNALDPANARPVPCRFVPPFTG
jgi:pimeloyl-ACP methyl ester carboxylesterase